MQKLDEHVSLLEKAGFSAAAKTAKDNADRAGRMARAYEHYRYVSQETISKFQEKLKAETIRRTGKAGFDLYENYDQLVFEDSAAYSGLPPADVLESVSAAREIGVFDTFEVATVKSVREYHDPLVFGRISGCDDRFYIAQWGDDVKITDLLGEHDG